MKNKTKFPKHIGVNSQKYRKASLRKIFRFAKLGGHDTFPFSFEHTFLKTIAFIADAEMELRGRCYTCKGANSYIGGEEWLSPDSKNEVIAELKKHYQDHLPKKHKIDIQYQQ